MSMTHSAGFATHNHSATLEPLYCALPIAIGTDATILFVLPSPSPNIPFSSGVVASSGTAVASSAVIGAVGGSPSSVSEGARGQIALQIASCQKNTPLQIAPLPWSSSPTFMSIGQDDLRYNRGAVVGNWVLLSSMALIHRGAAACLDVQKTRFPGALIFPVLFLAPPTATAAMNLIRYGDAGDTTLGAFSLGAQSSGALGIALFLRPAHFKAQWDFKKLEWADTSQEGYVSQYGLIFRNYYDQRQWFQACEILFSTTIGALNAYQTGLSSCVDLMSIGAAAYGAYAVAVIALRPAANRFDRVYYGTVASMQFLSVSLALIGTEIGSFALRQAGSGLAVTMQWVTTARSIANLFVAFGRNLLPRFLVSSQNPPEVFQTPEALRAFTTPDIPDLEEELVLIPLQEDTIKFEPASIESQTPSMSDLDGQIYTQTTNPLPDFPGQALNPNK